MKKSGCFIATATYGSEVAPQVQFLRGFRDGTVQATFAGANFMAAFNAFYYSWSPGVADVISGNAALREAMKVILYPLIWSLQFSSGLFPLFTFTELGVAVAGFVTSSLLGLIYVAPIVYASSRRRKRAITSHALRLVAMVWAATAALMILAEIALAPQVMMASSGAFVLTTICLASLVAVNVVRRVTLRSF